MVKTRSMTRNHNHYASSKKRFNNDHPTPWLVLNHDVLFLVMMQLGVVDFLAFLGVCKSWRSFALSNMHMFMASGPPMSLSISTRVNKIYNCEMHQKDYHYHCYLENFEGRKFKTIIPYPAGTTCVGSTCGYLIFYGRETHGFCLVNPITRHQLHFPGFLSLNCPGPEVRAIHVFSPSISGWLFAMKNGVTDISFSIVGQEAWNHVSSTLRVVALHAFKGKIYTIHNSCHLSELRLEQQPKLMLLKTHNFPLFFLCRKLVGLGEDLYVMKYNWLYDFDQLHKLEFDKMKWVLLKKSSEEFAFFFTRLVKYSDNVKPEFWVAPLSEFERFPHT